MMVVLGSQITNADKEKLETSNMYYEEEEEIEGGDDHEIGK